MALLGSLQIVMKTYLLSFSIWGVVDLIRIFAKHENEC